MAEVCFILRYHFNFNLSKETLLEKLNWKLKKKWKRNEDYLVPCQASNLTQWAGVQVPVPAQGRKSDFTFQCCRYRSP